MDGYNAIDVFSINEVKTNKIWWNGTEYKTVYRKCYQGTSTASYVIASNVEDMVDSGGYWIDDSNQQSVFPFDTSAVISVRKTTTNNLIFSSASLARPCKIWVEYTKITD